MRRRRSSKASSGMLTWYGRMSLAGLTVLLMTTSVVGGNADQCSDRNAARSHLVREEVRLLPGREVVALVDLVEVDEVGVGRLRPAPRRLIELSRRRGRFRGGGRLHAASPASS